jgi:YHS domain-containing protein
MKSILTLVASILLISCSVKQNNSEIFIVDGKAIRGYDAVAFHREQKAVQGNKVFSYDWSGATWQFASASNRDLFKADPGKYAPQYGGYCAYGTAEGHKAPTETETWTVRDGKLYFNYNKEVKDLWMKDQEGFIKKADKLWPTVKDDEF